MKPHLLFCACLALAGCAQPAPSSTVRVCEGQVCADQPRAQTNQDLAYAGKDTDGRIAALEKLAQQSPRAAYDLGLRYFRGDGITQDSYKALTWMRKAAEEGDLDAQKALGRAYLTGLEEMGSDAREAQKWLSIAASRGDKESAELLKEANAARKSDDEYYKWQQRWRGTFYNYWYRGYPYFTTWDRGHWYIR